MDILQRFAHIEELKRNIATTALKIQDEILKLMVEIKKVSNEISDCTIELPIRKKR